MNARTVDVRPVQDGDAEGLAELAARSADGGRVGVRVRRTVPLLESVRVRGADAVGFVATAARGELVGAAWVAYSAASAAPDGTTAQLAYLHSLDVDPAWRRQGVGRALTQARLQDAASRDGECLVAASIQAGNEASTANARHWAQRSLGTVRVTPVPPPRRPPRARSGVFVRPVRSGDLDQVAQGLRDHARHHVLAPVPTTGELEAWLAQRVRGEALNAYVVAVAPDGRVLAGLGLQDESRLSTLEVTHLPRALVAANLALRVVPRDRLMRNLNVRLPWFDPAHEPAARQLWRTVRWDWRRRGSSIVVQVDPTSPITRMLRAPRWLPSTTLEVLVREPGSVHLPASPLGLVP